MCAQGNHLKWVCDLADLVNVRPSLLSLMEQNSITIGEFVHSAGIPSTGALRLSNVALVQRTMNVNVLSALEIASALLRKNPNQGQLSGIVFLSSIWSMSGSTGHVLYSASKGALDAAVRSIAIECAPVVRANSLVLGAIETPMASPVLSNNALMQSLSDVYPLGLGKPKDAVDACVFLLSDEARWITGQSIVVDGGRSVQMSN